jgi:hypothetical protein|tara:strand:- start:393 stop:560 length:168 start_codon:yes stop_codon:yes gene_type:complete
VSHDFPSFRFLLQKKNTHLFPRVNKKAQIRYYSIKRSATGERIVIVVVIFSVRAK